MWCGLGALGAGGAADPAVRPQPARVAVHDDGPPRELLCHPRGGRVVCAAAMQRAPRGAVAALLLGCFTLRARRRYGTTALSQHVGAVQYAGQCRSAAGRSVDSPLHPARRCSALSSEPGSLDAACTGSPNTRHTACAGSGVGCLVVVHFDDNASPRSAPPSSGCGGRRQHNRHKTRAHPRPALQRVHLPPAPGRPSLCRAAWRAGQVGQQSGGRWLVQRQWLVGWCNSSGAASNVLTPQCARDEQQQQYQRTHRSGNMHAPVAHPPALPTVPTPVPKPAAVPRLHTYLDDYQRVSASVGGRGGARCARRVGGARRLAADAPHPVRRPAAGAAAAAAVKQAVVVMTRGAATGPCPHSNKERRKRRGGGRSGGGEGEVVGEGRLQPPGVAAPVTCRLVEPPTPGTDTTVVSYVHVYGAAHRRCRACSATHRVSPAVATWRPRTP